MKLDEAIKYIEEVVKEKEERAWEIQSLEEHYTCKECVEKYCQLIEWLKELKQLREQTKWIPCSEKLPKVNEYENKVCKYYLIQDEFEDMYVAHYTSVGWIPIESLYAIETKVVAWMPLPKKYKVKTEKTEINEEKMSIEEAIICLKDMKTIGHNVCTSKKTFENVLDMAIRSLEIQKKLAEFSGMDICN